MCLESWSSDVKTGSFTGKQLQTGWLPESPWQRTYEEEASIGTVCPNRDRASAWTFYLPSRCSKMRWMPLASQNKSRQIISLVGQSVWSGPFFLPIQGVGAHVSLNWYAVGSVLETRSCLDTHVIGPPRGRNSMRVCRIWVNSHGEVTAWAHQYRTQVPHPTGNQK